MASEALFDYKPHELDIHNSNMTRKDSGFFPSEVLPSAPKATKPRPATLTDLDKGRRTDNFHITNQEWNYYVTGLSGLCSASGQQSGNATSTEGSDGKQSQKDELTTERKKKRQPKKVTTKRTTHTLAGESCPHSKATLHNTSGHVACDSHTATHPTTAESCPQSAKSPTSSIDSYTRSPEALTFLHERNGVLTYANIENGKHYLFCFNENKQGPQLLPNLSEVIYPSFRTRPCPDLFFSSYFPYLTDAL
jgi:hypothetical protein